MIDERAICHEAGHAIVALNFGLRVCEIKLERSLPTLAFARADATLAQLCAVFAGGVAAEQIIFRGNNHAASSSDRQLIEQLGGGTLEEHLDYATQIINANIGCHQEMRTEMAQNWLAEDGASVLQDSDSEKLTFSLLGADRIMAIWIRWHP